MSKNEELKFEAIDDEASKHYEFENTGITGSVEQVFSIASYPVSPSIKNIKFLTVKNNKFWIVSAFNELYTMKIGNPPVYIKTGILKGSDIISLTADERGHHVIILTKNERSMYKLFYMSTTDSLQKISGHQPLEEISCYTL